MIRIAIFASGTGTNAARIIEYFRLHETIGVALVVTNKPGAGVVEIARKAGIPTLFIERERFFEGDSYLPELTAKRIDFIVLAGFLWKIPKMLISHYQNAIINIHPALLPKYGGKGMYGINVHAAVIQAGDAHSGITIHFVDEHYDNGDVIFQEQCAVLDDDTPQSLAERIHKLEHQHFPRVIEQVAMLYNQKSS